METDDSKRNRSGVVCTLVLNDEGRARLVMDDAELSEAQLREIGFAVAGRLAAFEQSKRKRQP